MEKVFSSLTSAGILPCMLGTAQPDFGVSCREFQRAPSFGSVILGAVYPFGLEVFAARRFGPSCFG